MDISDTLAPNSDQLDAIELSDGPRTFTIRDVSAGTDDQPVNVHLVNFPRPWRPGKNMRRVLAECWGKETAKWVGHRALLYRDPEVVFGREKVGGIRIKALSGIDRPQQVPVLVGRGRTALYTVQPLPDAPTTPLPDPQALADTIAKASQATTKAELRPLFNAAKRLGMDEHTEADLLAYAETLS